jgi:ABC-type sulfate/molybdate transport systems ATPase subunit
MALARALAAKPRVLLLDEPFGALDARVRAELRDWLRRLHEEVHVTTVFVTHDQEEAMEVADRVAVFDHGRLEQVGAPAELYDNPASEFVLRFVGDAVRLGSQLVRPHEIVVRRWPSDGAVEVEVERIAVLGADVRVDLVDGNGERFAARLRREQLEDLDLARGEIVWAGAEPFLTRDPESDELFRSLGSDLDTIDVSATRAVTAEVDESLDGGGLALEDGLDSPVGTIPHPTGDTVRSGGPLDGEAEPDALDEAVHDDA